MSNGQSGAASFDPDEFMKKRQGGGTATSDEFDPDAFMQGTTAPESEAEPVEPTEEEYPGLTAKGLENIRQGAKARPKTEFEKQRPDEEWYGFTPSHISSEAWKGAKGIVGGLGQMAYDTAFGELNPATGEIEHGPGALLGLDTEGGVHPIDRASALYRKYMAEPAIAEWDKGNEIAGLPSWDKRTETTLPGYGHKLAGVMAGAVPILGAAGPWAAGLGEQAGTGDIGGAAGQALGAFAGGELMGEAPRLAKSVGAKVLFNTPMTDRGKIEQAVRQLLAVRPPGVNETEYRLRVEQAVRDLQDIAIRNQILNPRDGRNAVNDRINQIEQPIGDHLAGVNLQVFPDQYLPMVNEYIDRALADIPGALTPKEKMAAKQKVFDFLRDPLNPDAPKMGEELEGNRRRLNDDAEKFYKADTAGKNSIDVSDATAIAQRAAADAIRDYLYGKDGQVGFLERSGLKAFDDMGRQISFRDVRRRVGNLIEIRNHLEKAITRAEKTGNWNVFSEVGKGPSLAAGGAGALYGAMKGHPVQGVVAGEAAKAWGKYRNPTNINELTARAFENLRKTAPGTTPAITVQRPGQILPPQFPGGQGAIPPSLAFNPVQGPPPAPGPFQFGVPPGGGPQAGGPSTAPAGSLWQQQVPPGLPPLEQGFVPPSPQFPSGQGAVGPPGPRHGPELPPGPFEIENAPGGGPGPLPAGGLWQQHVGTLPEIEQGGGPPPGQFPSGQGAPPEGEIQGPARDIRRNPKTGRMETFPPKTMQTTPAEYLRVGNTFVDDKGEPRRVVEIKEDGTVVTQDHGEPRSYEGEIQHQGEINSPQARLAQGGMFHPAEGEEGPENLSGLRSLWNLLKGEEGTLTLGGEEEPEREGEIAGAAGLGEIGRTRGAPIAPMGTAADTRVSREEAASSLRQKLNRREDIGQPANEHLGPKILQDEKGKYLVGRLDPDQFIERLQTQHTPEELKLWRAWYDDIGKIFEEKWGTGIEGARKFMGWLLSQQRASPSVGMGSVFRVEDMMKGQPKIKAGGLAEAKIRAILGGLPVGKGLKAKLNDFADSALGKTTRTWMGDDPRGGQPAAIDVWAARGAGYFDQVLIDYITKRFGAEAAEGLVADFKGGPSEQQYERASEYYNDMAGELNRRNFDGGGWTPKQVQAVDWGAVGKQQGRHMELPKEILGKNVRRMAYEVDPGFGTALQQKFPPLSSIDPAKAAAITKDVAEHALQIVSREAGGYIHHKIYGPGGWTDLVHGMKKTMLNPSAIVDVLGSPEAAERTANMLGYLLQQSKILSSRVMGRGNGHAFEIREVGSNKLADPATLEKFWTEFNKQYPKATGFQPIRDPDGTVGIQNLKEHGHYSDIEIPKLQAAAEAAADAVGIGHIETEHHEAEVRSAENDWAKQTKGESYLNRLKELGATGIVKRLRDEYAPSVERRLRQAWMEHAMDEWREWASKQTGR